MEADTESFFALAEALGIGLLIGIEREQSEHTTGKDASSGVRTFALASLIGAISMMTGGMPLLAVAVLAVGTFRIVWVVQQGDPTTGLTTSLALVAVVLLGALATETALLAAGVGVIIASLLAAREVIRGFSRTVLTAAELRDGLILGVSILVILPVLPNLNFGPGGALNPRDLFIIVVLVMLIGAAGHIATRVVGVHLGLPVSGFLSGFVSSTATIAALGRRAGEKSDDAKSAAAGATLSSVSSLIQIGIILLALSPAMFAVGLPVLLGAGLAAGLHGAAIFFLTQRGEIKPAEIGLTSQVFSVKSAVGFAFIVATVMLISALLNDYFGSAAILVTATLAGLVSTNSATVALASLVAVGQISALEGVLPLAAALSANTLVRIWIALRSSEPSFRRTVSGGLVLQLAVLWVAWWLDGIARAWITELSLTMPL
ncbi:hypothetical protein CDQ92_01845 [Sphingopyxis bauzanensis]|uniref:Uncharacterized protein n=1 Tax=Sphingopyxis bauzanensis TaxID=651663 RepID=A0A246K0C4_9SPHN|nr:DUF4010 domain-containing protein [Sphingopyxis bauzanensis]OWQ98952.1 hypothetical protein CDQ92_01845 [Sphingopyxis bauzanensis]GGJ65911.1 hypothetical protein GCM10011393_40240 [Sphingopyxis bauzanensis]